MELQVYTKIANLLSSRGLAFRTLSVRHLVELKNELDSLYCAHSFDEGFYRERLVHFSFESPLSLPGALSLLVVAAPQPEMILELRWKGQDHAVTVPPTYDGHEDEDILRRLRDLIRGGGHHLEKSQLPLKWLAVRCGLFHYGRNNVAYLPGYGSYHRLMAFYTDLPGLEDHWGLPVMMARCERCTACQVACPTHAIDSGRFLLHAERCLTYHNEHAGAFPPEIDPSLHHCLFGCMICQRVCPENRKHPPRRELRTRFTEEETASILRKVPLANLSSATRDKIDKTGLSSDYPLWARNLGVLLKEKGSA